MPGGAGGRDRAFGVTFEPAVIVYNRDLVPPTHVPDTRFDLLRLMREHADTYRGRIVTYDIEESGVGYLLATQDAVVGGVFGSLLEAISEEHTSELQSLMRISYAVFCLTKQISNYDNAQQHQMRMNKT